ncbi:Suppressor of tumorigenicity 14 protein [Mactra antiquata]
MADYCDGLIEITDVYFGSLTIDSSYIGDCNVTMVTRMGYNRLNFYFDQFDLGKRHIHCEHSYLTVYDGADTDTSPPINGLDHECGSKRPRDVYASTGRFLTFRYYNNESSTFTKSMDLIFTAFHKGYCYSYEYSCSNGHCIDDSVNCNGFNPCGDNSDCRLSTGAVIGIVLGSLFGACVLVALTCVIIRNRKRSRHMIQGYSKVIHSPPTQMPTPVRDVTNEVTNEAVVRAATPVPSHGMSHNYGSTATYNVPTGIQDT